MAEPDSGLPTILRVVPWDLWILRVVPWDLWISVGPSEYRGASSASRLRSRAATGRDERLHHLAHPQLYRATPKVTRWYLCPTRYSSLALLPARFRVGTQGVVSQLLTSATEIDVDGTDPEPPVVPSKELPVDIFSLLSTCRRQWFVVLPILCLTGVAAWFATTMATPTYEATASVLVLGPSVDGSNPFGELNNAITSTAIAIQRSVTGEAVAVEIAESGLSSDFDVTPSDRGQEPILDVTARAPDEATALKTVAAVMGAIDHELSNRQKQQAVAEENLITTQVLAMDNKAQIKSGSAFRSALLISVLGIALAAFAAVSAEQVRSRTVPLQPTPELHSEGINGSSTSNLTNGAPHVHPSAGPASLPDNQ